MIDLKQYLLNWRVWLWIVHKLEYRPRAQLAGTSILEQYTRTDLDERIDKEWAGDTREQGREGYGTDDFGSELLFEQIAL
jgi:hypothetical protein